jgi:hypothetical protein
MMNKYLLFNKITINQFIPIEIQNPNPNPKSLIQRNNSLNIHSKKSSQHKQPNNQPTNQTSKQTITLQNQSSNQSIKQASKQANQIKSINPLINQIRLNQINPSINIQ